MSMFISKINLAFFNQVFNGGNWLLLCWSQWAGVRAGVNLWFTIDNLCLLWPIDTKLEVWETYIKSVMKVKVTVAKICFRLITSGFLWPIDTNLGMCVAYAQRKLLIASQVSAIKVKVTVAWNRNSVSAEQFHFA